MTNSPGVRTFRKTLVPPDFVPQNLSRETCPAKSWRNKTRRNKTWRNKTRRKERPPPATLPDSNIAVNCAAGQRGFMARERRNLATSGAIVGEKCGGRCVCGEGRLARRCARRKRGRGCAPGRGKSQRVRPLAASSSR